MLADEDATSFVFDEEMFRWRDWKISAAKITQRRQLITSLGSCSFDEPRDDLRALGLFRKFLIMSKPLLSFVDVSPESHFPLQNLPYGIFRPPDGKARAGVAIGDLVLDLAGPAKRAGFFRDLNFGERPIFAGDSLNAFLALGRPAWRKTREVLQHLLAADTSTLRDDEALRKRAFHRQKDVLMQLPARIGDYTDFYSSYHHAFNVGTMFRGPANALMPNWKWLPIAYHGRASSIVPSGTEVRRPHGQIKPPDARRTDFCASRALDFELETAFFIGPPNKLGEPVPIAQAVDHIFGTRLDE